MSNLTNKIEAMKGKLWMYHTRQYKIIDYNFHQENNELVISTDVKNIKLDIDKAPEILENDFLPVEDEKSLAIQGQQIIPEAQNLTSIIMDNIKKVRSDKSYINQANAVNKSVNTLLSIAKIQLEVIKAQNKGK